MGLKGYSIFVVLTPEVPSRSKEPNYGQVCMNDLKYVQQNSDRPVPPEYKHIIQLREGLTLPCDHLRSDPRGSACLPRPCPTPLPGHLGIGDQRGTSGRPHGLATPEGHVLRAGGRPGIGCRDVHLPGTQTDRSGRGKRNVVLSAQLLSALHGGQEPTAPLVTFSAHWAVWLDAWKDCWGYRDTSRKTFPPT